MTTKSFIKTIGSKGLLSDYNTEGKKLQTELAAGDNITIANNVISAANILNPIDISDYNNKDFNNLPSDNVLYYKNSSTNFKNQPGRGAYRFIQWTASTYYSVQIAIDANNMLFARSSYRANPGDSFKTWEPWVKFQTELTFDTTPTAGSNNPVTSDGINAALYKKINIYQIGSGKYHVKNNEYYSFVCRAKIGPWDRIQSNFYCLSSDSAAIGSFNMFIVLGTSDTSLHTPERIALNGGIVWNLNYRGIQVYNNYTYKFYVCKSGDYFYFYAKRSNNNDKELTAMRSKLLYSTNDSVVSDASYDLDDNTWQGLNMVEMTNVYTNTTKEELNERVPAPTSTTGTQVLKCINGVIQWVNE